MPQLIARNHQCLMIEADDRHYFTNEEHMPQLLEFCKSFDMKMSIVKVEQAPILDIADLPKAVCDTKKTPKAQFKLVRKVLPFDALCIPAVRTRSHILETAKTVRMKIRDRFLKGEAISRDMLEDELPNATISSATFMQHVRTARKELEKKGYMFERISIGCYRSITPEQQKAALAEKTALAAKNQPTWTKYKTTITNHFEPTVWTPINPGMEFTFGPLTVVDKGNAITTIAHTPGTEAEKIEQVAVTENHKILVDVKPTFKPVEQAQPNNLDPVEDLPDIWTEIATKWALKQVPAQN